MEMRVGVLVMVTAREMNQKAMKVMPADRRRERVEVRERERGAVRSLLGRRRLVRRERRTANTPDISIRWTVVIRSLAFITPTLMTLPMAQAAATEKHIPTPRRYSPPAFISSAEV